MQFANEGCLGCGTGPAIDPCTQFLQAAIERKEDKERDEKEKETRKGTTMAETECFFERHRKQLSFSEVAAQRGEEAVVKKWRTGERWSEDGSGEQSRCLV